MKPFPQAVREDFFLPPAHVDHCSSYFLRHWELGYFLDKLDWNPMSIFYDGIHYHVIFMDNLNWREEWDQVRLSFRKPTDESIPAYVLVKGIAK